VKRAEGPAAGGRHFLRITSKRGRTFFAAASLRKQCAVKSTPCVTFQYKIPPRVKVGLLVYTNLGWRAIRLTARDKSKMVIGDAGIVSDGQWRQATVNIRDMLLKDNRKHTRIAKWAFTERGDKSNRKGATFAIDDFTICTEQRVEPVLELCIDEKRTGLRKVGVMWDKRPHTANVPMRAWDGRPLPVTLSRPFTGYVHVRVADGAGNSSKILHRPVELP
jgi:hypothetical protein